MKHPVLAVVGLALGVFAGVQLLGDDEETVSLEDLPIAVIDAALEAVPGLEITGAETEDDGGFHFDVQGHVDGVEVEIEIREDGTVLEVEWEGDEVESEGDEVESESDEAEQEDEGEDNDDEDSR